MTLKLLTLLTACPGPQVQVQLPADTAPATTPQGPFESVRLVRQARQELSASASGPQAGDVDGDGLADVGFVVGSRDLAWAKGLGDGDLSPQELLPEGLLITRMGQALGTDGVDEASVFLQDLQLVDLDGDGASEWLLTASAQVDAEYTLLTLVLSDPMGAASLELVGPRGHQAQAVSDLDGDGLPELVLFGEDSAVFTSGGAQWPLPEAVGWSMYPQAAAMELDGAGGRDLVVFVNGGFGISEVHSFLQSDEGLILSEIHDSLFANEACISLASEAAQEALLLAGDRVLRFGQEGLSEEISETSSFYWGVAGDLDDDGALDLLALTAPEPTLFASSPLGPLSAVPLQGPEASWDSAVILDLDGDGRQDLVGIRSLESGAQELESWLNVSGD